MDYLERITNPLTGEMPSTLAGAVELLGGAALRVAGVYPYTEFTTKDNQVFLLFGLVPDAFINMLSDVYEMSLQVKRGVLTWK